jgi:two-component system, OmpR family, sensor histidine kinase MtrB
VGLCGREAHPLDLRTALKVGIAVLGGLALAAAVALVALTGLLERSARDMAAASRSVQLAEELEIDLLSQDRVIDPHARQGLADELRRRFAEFEIHIADVGEAALLDRVRRSAAAYFDAIDRAEPQASAARAVFAELQKLVRLNAAQATQAAARAEQLNRIARWVGVSIAGLLVVGAAVLLMWLRRALEPVLHIGDAMSRYGRGERSARAPERGPAELRDMAARFNQMASALERQKVAQLTSLAGVAHDLRNPLAALRSSAELLGASERPGPERLQLVSSVLHRQIDRIDRMLGDLLDAARIEAGELELRRELCSVSSLAAEVVDLYRSTTRSHEIELRTEDRALVFADPTRLSQVLTNLISNGIKYSPHGGAIEVAVAVDDDRVAITVADPGIGIEAADLGRLFEPFQRGGSARDVAPGAGLGLSVVRRIVEAHGGEIRVASEPGRGSTFEVRLVRADGTDSPSSPVT